jgi:hypothetical protein
VLDTVGSGELWTLAQRAKTEAYAPVLVAPAGSGGSKLRFERVNRPDVMSPWEIQQHLDFLFGQAQPHPSLEAVRTRLERFVCAWSALWAEHGDSGGGIAAYRDLVLEVRRELGALPGGGGIHLSNGKPLYLFLEHVIFIYALSPEVRAASGLAEAARPVAVSG